LNSRYYFFCSPYKMLDPFIYVMGNNANTGLYIKLPVGGFFKRGGMYIVSVQCTVYSVQCILNMCVQCTVYIGRVYSLY
jgi:hypothetical protein